MAEAFPQSVGGVVRSLSRGLAGEATGAGWSQPMDAAHAHTQGHVNSDSHSGNRSWHSPRSPGPHRATTRPFLPVVVHYVFRYRRWGSRARTSRPKCQAAALLAALPSASANATGTALPIQRAMRFLVPKNS